MSKGGCLLLASCERQRKALPGWVELGLGIVKGSLQISYGSLRRRKSSISKVANS